jgi:hypothetical protein
LSFISEDQSKGVKNFTEQSERLFEDRPVQTLMHDSVFTKLDSPSKLFKVLVLKTNETIPYTSTFLQLDCSYWNGGKERQWRDNMNAQK